MSQRQDRKMRRMLRREIDFHKEVLFKSFKKKPRFVPTWLWLAGLKVFVNINPKG